MKAGFVIGLGMCVMAGFNSQYVRSYEPFKEDGISRVGEPDWDAETEMELAKEEILKAEAEELPKAESVAGAEEILETEPEIKEELLAEANEEEAVEAAGEWVSLGDDWVITYYCPLACCNDQWAWQTSTQEPMQLHHTIAVDPSVIPYYTHVRIGGLDYEYVAEDCGGGIKGKRIDVLVDNCTLANEMGVDRNIEVWVKK